MLRTVARYDRIVGASLERAWENVRDWEHLPWLHNRSFRSIELVAGSAAEGKLLALYGRDGVLRAALGVNAPRWVMPMRKQLLDRARLDEARAVVNEMTSS